MTEEKGNQIKMEETRSWYNKFQVTIGGFVGVGIAQWLTLRCGFGEIRYLGDLTLAILILLIAEFRNLEIDCDGICPLNILACLMCVCSVIASFVYAPVYLIHWLCLALFTFISIILAEIHPSCLCTGTRPKKLKSS